MQIPSMLYGTPGRAMSRARKKLRDIVKRNAEFENEDFGPFIDTSEVDGLLIVEPEPIQLPGEHFHCYALSVALVEIGSASEMLARLDAWMRWSLLEPWRYLGVVEQHTTTALVRNQSLLMPYVDAAVHFWPILKAEGERYGSALVQPKDVWAVMHNLWYSLANLGIPANQLQSEPVGGPADFLVQLKAQS